MQNVRRCADCGWLWTRNPNTHELQEADEEARAKGVQIVLSQPGSFVDDIAKWAGVDRRPALFVCVMQEPQFAEDLSQLATTTRTALVVIEKDRDCTASCHWQPGSALKEYRDVMFHETLVKMEVERRRHDREWEAEQNRQNAERDRQNLEWQASQNARLAWIGAAATIAAGIASALMAWMAGK